MSKPARKKHGKAANVAIVFFIVVPFQTPVSCDSCQGDSQTAGRDDGLSCKRACRTAGGVGAIDPH